MPSPRQLTAQSLTVDHISVDFTLADGSVWGRVPLQGCNLDVSHIWHGVGGFTLDAPVDLFDRLAKHTKLRAQSRPTGYIVSWGGRQQTTGRIVGVRSEWSADKGPRKVWVGAQDNILLQDMKFLPRDVAAGTTVGSSAQIVLNTLFDNMTGNAVNPRDSRDLIKFRKTSYPEGDFGTSDGWGPRRSHWFKATNGLKFVKDVASRWDQLSCDMRWERQGDGGQIYFRIFKPLDLREKVVISARAFAVSSWSWEVSAPKANSALVSAGKPNVWNYVRDNALYNESLQWGRRHIDLSETVAPDQDLAKASWPELGATKLRDATARPRKVLEYDGNVKQVFRRGYEFRDGDIILLHEPGLFIAPGRHTGFALSLGSDKLELKYRMETL